MTALHNLLGYGHTDDAVGTVSYVAGEAPVDTTWRGAMGGTSGLVEMARAAQSTPA